MNTLPKNLLLLGVLLTAAPAAWAQTAATKPKPAPNPAQTEAAPQATGTVDDAKIEAQADALTRNLKQALALSPQQETRVRQINLRSVRQVEQARMRYRTDLRKLNATVEEIGQGRLTSLKDVLTPEQFYKYQQQREKKMGIPNVQGNQGNAVPGLPPGSSE